MTKARKPSQIDKDISKWVNSLSTEQMTRLYDVIDGPIDPESAKLTDDELLAELTND